MGLPTNCYFNAQLIVEYDLAFIAELGFLNERSEFRNSSSAIQVTMKTKTLFFILLSIIILDC
ncbi:MAG: hypothetical protein LBG48_05825, partial [Rickettsiales bacterium]|nr:hypothetical protein [Rickettsiales bacterium]